VPELSEWLFNIMECKRGVVVMLFITFLFWGVERKSPAKLRTDLDPATKKTK
jgi:hypothetical protein